MGGGRCSMASTPPRGGQGMGAGEMADVQTRAATAAAWFEAQGWAISLRLCLVCDARAETDEMWWMVGDVVIAPLLGAKETIDMGAEF